MTRGAALISLLTVAAFLFAPAAAAAGLPAAGGVREAATRQDALVVVESITPDAPSEPNTPITISGKVTNTGATPLTWLQVRLRFSRQPFAGRAQMQSFAAGGQILDTSRRSVPVAQLAASGQAPWEFTFTPAEIGMYRFGVHPVTIELVDSAQRQLAAQRTFLLYAPAGQAPPRTKISWALPIVDQPHRADDDLFVDEELRRSMADDGRLGRILKIAGSPAKGVSWFVDPALLDDAQVMSQGYSLGTGDDGQEKTAKPGDPVTGAWLRDLRTALTDTPVTATPYADPDVAALVHTGMDDATGAALTKGAAVASQLLGKDVTTGVNWPVGGVIDHDALDALAVGDVRTVLLGAAALPLAAPLTYTPDAAASLETVMGRVRVLLADPVLSELVTPAEGTAVLAKQRFLAETAMISAETAPRPRAVVVAPPRRWSPDPGYVTDLLRTAASVPWLKPVSLGSIKPATPPVPRTDLTYTDKDRAAELAKSYMTGTEKLSDRAALTSTVTGDQRRPFDTALLRLASSAWRGRTGSAVPFVEQVDRAIARRTDAISVTTGEQRTLAGKNGIVPITIRNDLPDQEATVGVKITSRDRRLLTIGSYESPVTIGPGGTRQLDIPMEANGGGQIVVKVQLTTADGTPYDQPVELTVTTTGYGAIVLVIVGGAVTVLLAAVALRVVSRRSRRLARSRRASQAAPPAVAAQREGPS
ncbi:DUF6049 family protein [Sphaerisporangium aureirubrum]|uniref:DUF6049 family protein n=1 Tax=Sphaerisporangium aureirubrum TaxID=1544736 RepID=A0ABW1NRT7_9ACTN